MKFCKTKSGQQTRSAIILAGGEGTRLRPLTSKLSGDNRPKQFCAVVSGQTLLEETRRRVSLLISLDRTLVVVTRAHQRFYAPLLGDMRPQGIVVQPENRGTASAILYGLLRLADQAPEASVAIFPSDHYVADDQKFMGYVDTAFRAVDTAPELIVLLGLDPKKPEVEYGWIEPGKPIFQHDALTLFRVRRFWEKPSIDVALALLDKGCFWNTFVLVGRISAFFELMSRALPQACAMFAAIQPVLHTRFEDETAKELYARLPVTNFSEKVLVRHPETLAMLPVTDLGWNDLGEPSRVLATLARIQPRPEWPWLAAKVRNRDVAGTDSARLSSKAVPQRG